jgi:hypothetical protein
LFPCADPNVTPKDIITKLSHLKTMVQCGGIWFANGKFGVTWRFVQGMIQPKLSMRGKCHLSLSSSESSKVHSESTLDHHEDEEQEQQQQQQPQQRQQKQEKHFTTATVDSDDGVSDGEEEEEESAVRRTASVAVPVSAPVTVAVEAPKKKIVKKVA